VILLTGHGTLDTCIAALRAGAADYILKPFEPTELCARVEQVARSRVNRLREVAALNTIARGLDQLRGAAPEPSSDNGSAPAAPHDVLRVGALMLDPRQHSASFDGRPLHLTPIEYRLLHCLAESPGELRTYRELVSRTHNQFADDQEARLLLKSHVRNLRRKIPSAYLVNVGGCGYRLRSAEGEVAAVS
jgi:DNA-binding response OmpR family regulator